MKIAIFVNRPSELWDTRGSAQLISLAAARGHEVLVVPVDGLTLTADGRIRALGRRAPEVAADIEPRPLCEQLLAEPLVQWSLEECDLVLLRLNPARDDRSWAHDACLALTRMLRDRGVTVLNDPVGLHKARNKLYLSALPRECTPRTLVSSTKADIVAFIEDLGGEAILKPLSGTHGRDVFRIAHEEHNLGVIIEVLLRQGLVIAQEYLAGGVDGDTRLLLVDGEPFTVEGHYAAVRRVPGRGDFRSNVHAGGRPVPAEVTDGILETARRVGVQLRRDGLWLAGLDLIDDKVIEVNVFSPGGLPHASRHTGVDFGAALFERLEELGAG